MSFNNQSHLTVQPTKNCCRRMGKNLEKTCAVCFKTMRGNNLKRHMLKHENGRKEELKVNQKKEEQNNIYDALRKKMTENNEDFERKIELGCKARNIMYENSNLRIAAMTQEIQEAIELYDRYGQNANNKQITW